MRPRHSLSTAALTATLTAAFVAVLTTSAIYATPSQAASSGSRPVASTQTSQDWLVGQGMLDKLNQAQPATAAWFYNTPSAYDLSAAPTGYATTNVVDFTSYAAFQQHVRSLHTGTWVQYDNEAWAATPLVEQQKPVTYMRAFAQLAHRHGLKVIEAPARDLMSVPGAVCTQRSGETIDAAYLRCGIPAAARYADIFDVQAQADQGSLTAYTSLVAAAAQQFRRFNSSAPILAGLSTDRGASATTLYNCWAATHASVQGFWLNTQTASIPVAVAALDAIKTTSLQQVP